MVNKAFKAPLLRTPSQAPSRAASPLAPAHPASSLTLEVHLTSHPGPLQASQCLWPRPPAKAQP